MLSRFPVWGRLLNGSLYYPWHLLICMYLEHHLVTYSLLSSSWPLHTMPAISCYLYFAGKLKIYSRCPVWPDEVREPLKNSWAHNLNLVNIRWYNSYTDLLIRFKFWTCPEHLGMRTCEKLWPNLGRYPANVYPSPYFIPPSLCELVSRWRGSLIFWRANYNAILSDLI